MNKEKFFRFIKKHITPDVIKIIIFVIPILIVLCVQCSAQDGFKIENFIDATTLVAVLIVFICESLSALLIHLFAKKFEDQIKLTTDYKGLVDRYCRSKNKFISYKDIVFPVEDLFFRFNNEPSFNIDFDHTNCANKYTLPSQISDNSDIIMKAHANSKIYNNINVRIDDIYQENGTLMLLYSRTYYYDSLLTNRAMDYRFKDDKSIRDIYEPGSFISPLNESKFSNHLGFNGFIELSDNNIIFVKRKDNLSIGKKTLGCSIGASLKSKYALNDDRKCDVDGLNRSIIKEIKDELNIDIDEKIDLTKNIFCFCRDIVEGGRPQFIFYYKVENLNKEQFLEKFKSRDKKGEKNNIKTDGNKFVFLNRNEIQKCEIRIDGITFPENTQRRKKSYPMVALASCSTALLFKHLNIIP